jgi:hypothetical protein
MTSITATAKEFFDACETGKGWEGCKTYCTADATFSAQAEPLAEVKTLAQYTDWMSAGKDAIGRDVVALGVGGKGLHLVAAVWQRPKQALHYRTRPGPTYRQEHPD